MHSRLVRLESRRKLLLFGLLLCGSLACNISQRAAPRLERGEAVPGSVAEEATPLEEQGTGLLDGAAGGPLGKVNHWLYIIDVDLEEETIARIESSTHDMVVLDFIPSENDNRDFPMAEVVYRLHDADHPKLVLAYVDIGQAEDYRSYWQAEWRIGDPSWIVSADPDGWEGNYPVGYWHDEWQNIWLGQAGYLQAILDAGFDGIYLDWVEAYSDEAVLELAAIEGVDPKQEMIAWVGDLARFGRERNSGFLVIAQNAAELVLEERYAKTVDGIAQEQVWFDGGADNDPPGDCPLPSTELLVDTEDYYDSLPPICQRQYDDYPDSTLHVSSESYLEYLQVAQVKGLVVFTVDYATKPENITWVYETSRAMGFIPFVGSRGLDSFEAPFAD